MLVQEFLERSTERSPGKVALVAGPERLTYEEVDAGANRLAGALAQAGVRYADRVVVFLDNSKEAVLSIFGILKADAVFVVVNHTTKEDKLAFILNNSEAAAIITHRKFWNVAGKAASQAPSLKAAFVVDGDPDAGGNPAIVPFQAALDAESQSRRPVHAIDIDLAALIYTSGTTGNPKGVMLTHRNMVSASTSITTYLENVEQDIILNVLPLSFDYGLYQVLMSAQFGGTVVLEKTFLYPYAVINLLKKERVTGFPIVPTISAILLQMEELAKERFEHLRYITNTAAALPGNHIAGLEKIFDGVQIYSMYGLTECKRVAYMPPGELDRKPDSVGIAMPNEQVYLVDDDGNRITGAGIAGELVVRGANVMQGYWRMPEETDKMLRPGRYPWERVLYTGDLFKMDEEGFLYFISRKDDIIKSRGEKVSPKEVESVLYGMDGVVEAAVVGVPDRILGEAIKAFVVPKDGSSLTDKEVIAYCKNHLEDFMVPKYVEFKKSLPKTSSGKITRKGL